MSRTHDPNKLARVLLTQLNEQRDNAIDLHVANLSGDRAARAVIAIGVVLGALALGFVLGGLR